MKRKLFFILVLVFSMNPLGFSEERQMVDRVAAIVNKEIITQSELDLLFRPIYEQVRKSYQGADLQTQLESLRLKLLNQLIEDRLVAQEAEKLGIIISDEEIAEEMTQFQKQFPDEVTFHKELEASGVSLEDLKKRFKERLSISQLHQEIIRGKVLVSPSEAEQYYKDHPDEFVQKEQIEVWCITLRKGEEAVIKGTMDEGVKRKAGELIAELKRGASFEEIAEKHSEDANAAKKGYLGYITRGSFVADIDKAVFALPENSISDVLETENSYHIFKVGKKQPASNKTFEESRDKINDLLFRKKAHERFVSWMEDLKKKSFISIR